MNLLIFKAKGAQDFKPRKRYDLDASLDEGTKQILDTLDVSEQRDDHHAVWITVAINAIACGYLLLLAWALTHGEDVAKSVAWLLKHLPT